MRLTEIQHALREARIDAWLFVDQHQVDPIAYRVLGLPLSLHASRRWFYLIPSKGEPRKLVHRIEAQNLASVPGETRTYSGWQSLGAELARLVSGQGKVAMQYSPNCAIPYVAKVDAGTVELVRSLGVEVVSSADLVQQFEAVWTSNQVESHSEAGRRVDETRREAFRFVAAELAAGRTPTEWEVGELVRRQFALRGLVTDHGPIVAVDANASDPHYEPSAERCAVIRPGCLVLIDMWAKLDQADSVFYDITWMGFCGGAVPDRVQNVFAVVTGARDAAIETAQAAVGARREICGFQVDDAARSVITRAGYGDFFFHRTGHSIGTNVHGSGANMDNLEAHDERRLIPNTCFSIEPGIYLPEFGIRSEVNVLVRESDAVVTGEIQREMLLLA